MKQERAQSASDEAWFPELPPQLTHDRQQMLLRVAREAIGAHLAGRPCPEIQVDDPELHRAAGVFVTLRTLLPDNVGGRPGRPSFEELALRGCIGHLPADTPLIKAVPQTAISAATMDPRFPPLRSAEMSRTRLKVAILSPPKPVSDAKEIVLGVHGLILVSGCRRGLLLPSVPVSYGWTVKAYLKHLHEKAGLQPGTWPANANLLRFATIAFCDAMD